ncbi:MAG: hypothetical protein AAF665_04250 [Pseudomonadota bacterium]
MTAIAQSFVAAGALLAGPMLALTAAAPVIGQVVLVVSPPWSDSSQIVLASDGALVGPVVGMFGALAVADDGTFFGRLKENGAWLVLDGTTLAEFCGVTI